MEQSLIHYIFFSPEAKGPFWNSKGLRMQKYTLKDFNLNTSILQEPAE